MAGEKRSDYYEALGEKFEEYMSDYDVERRLDLIFERLLGVGGLENRRVLEIGSGTGRISRAIRDAGGRLTLLDVGPRLVGDVAGELGCDGIAGDAQSLPVRDGVFDVVLSSECIEHTPDPVSAIREMCRVCHAGGTVCLTTPNRLWYPVLVMSQALKLRKYSGIENWIFPRRAAAIMRAEGMTDIQLSGCHLWPFQITFLRPLLRRADGLGRWLYPLMINFGILSRKPGDASSV